MKTVMVAAVAWVTVLLGAGVAHADDTPTPTPPPYVINGPAGPILPGNQQLPPICAAYMRACGFTYDPATGTWRPSG
jgi:hypothetical protein